MLRDSSSIPFVPLLSLVTLVFLVMFGYFRAVHHVLLGIQVFAIRSLEHKREYFVSVQSYAIVYFFLHSKPPSTSYRGPQS
jgi:hypothetical protein